MGGECSTCGTDEKCLKSLVEKPAGKRPLGRIRCDGRIILKWNLRKQGGKVWIEFIWLRIRT
jgi:hypothetical protein